MARTAFKIGCYLAFFTAALHMVGAHLIPQPAPPNETARQMMDLMQTYKLGLPGAADRTTDELMTGFSLIFALMLALSGGLGLIILRRSANDPLLLTSAARALSGAYLVMLATSITYFFLIPTLCTAAIALAFTTASVTKPDSAG